jgi:ankyrin repeat protein
LHHAVEEENLTLIKTLLNVAVNPNLKKRCGATPLTLAIIKKNEEIVKLLLESYAEYDDKFYTSVPGPRTMAGKLNIPSIEQLFDDLSTDETHCDKVIWDIVEVATVGHKHGIDNL